MTRTCLPIMLLFLTLCVACNRNQRSDEARVSISPTQPIKTTPAPVTDQWLGRWPGVQGTYLELARHQDGYAITIRNLDGPSTYQGRVAGDHLEFTRDGKTETIRSGNGQDTGMKWLLEKKNCLVIQKGSEGFCRD